MNNQNVVVSMKDKVNNLEALLKNATLLKEKNKRSENSFDAANNLNKATPRKNVAIGM